MNRDWILKSDMELVHWLCNLEANSDVVWFDLDPAPIVSHDDERVRYTQLDAYVRTRAGAIEWHEIKAADGDEHRSQKLAQENAAHAAGALYRRFTYADLYQHSRVAMRWLKVVSFAAAIRDHDYASYEASLISYLLIKKRGTICEIITALDQYDAPTLMGLIARFAIRGTIRLEVANLGFGPWSIWTLSSEGGPNGKKTL